MPKQFNMSGVTGGLNPNHVSENTTSTDVALEELPLPKFVNIFALIPLYLQTLCTSNHLQSTSHIHRTTMGNTDSGNTTMGNTTLGSTDSGNTTMGNTETIKEPDDEVTIDENEEEEEEEQQMFDDSTHGYLINYYDHRDCNKFLLAIFMYVIQMVLYSLLWSEAMTLVKEDQVEVTISFITCSEANGSLSADSLQCSAESETKWYHMMLPFVLLSIYIQPDIISCLSIIVSKKPCFKKLMTFVVMSESGFALLTGLLWCFQGIYKGSGYDAIVNSIGVLFIHDLDEQLFIAVEKMDSSRMKDWMGKCCKRCKCCHNFCALFCTILFVIIVAALGQVVAEIAWQSSSDDGSSDASDAYGAYDTYY